MTASVDRGPFVGRGRELADLRRWLADARSGSGGLILVSGPAGIGKTRLIEEAVTDVGPTTVVWGRSVDDPGAPPLWPWRRVLRALPEVDAAVAGALAEVDLSRERSADPAAARFRFVAAVTDALLAAAEPAGLVVVLEDLHWADESSARLLRHLAGEVRRSRLLVVGTFRDPAGNGLVGTLPELLVWPQLQSVVLAPLTEPDIGSYLTEFARAAVPPATVRRVHRRCGGNPLYLRAVTRLPAGSAAVDGSDGGTELRHVVRMSLAGLDRQVLDLVAMAAVVGEDVETGVLASMSALTHEEVVAGVDAAVRAGVLAPVSYAAGRRRFVHAVVRDGIYADLDASTREGLHRRAAEALEDSATADPSVAGVVAGHWLRAATDHATLRRAADWARRAATSATRSLAFDEAARFLSMALAALQRAGVAENDRAELLIDLATAEYRSGRFAQSLAHAEAASEAAQACRRSDLLTEAALVVHDVASPDFLPTLTVLCERALAEVDPARSPVSRARLLSQLASALADGAQLNRAVEASAAALALAEACADPTATIDAVRARMKAAPTTLDVAERLRLGRLAIVHGATTGQPLVALWGHKWRIDAALEIGNLPAVDEEMSQISALVDSTRLPVVRWHDLRLRASITALRGRFAAALALNDEASQLATTALAQDRSAAGMSHAFLCQLAQVTGELVGWSEQAAATLAAAPNTPIVAVSRALVLLLLGRRDEAGALYEELRSHAAEPAFASVVHGVPVNMASLAEEFGDAETAQILYEQIAARPFAAGGAGVFCSEPSAAYLGRLSVVLGRVEEAIGHFEEALTVSTRMGARPAVVLARIGLAGALVARGNPGDLPRAATQARKAADEARRLGMPGPLHTATELLDHARTAARASDPLTGREREIATLVSSALTNRQIAERLVLSERTVESHVRSILAKLGVANRTEIATSVLRPG